jgi:predicted FMN-binding regulatory protein PaiB
LWLKKEEDTGDYHKIPHQGRPQKIKDEEKFTNFLIENKDKTQQQMAELWDLPAYSPDLNKIENW